RNRRCSATVPSGASATTRGCGNSSATALTALTSGTLDDLSGSCHCRLGCRTSPPAGIRSVAAAGAGLAVSHMIQVGAKHHISVFQHWIRAFNDPHNVVTDLFVDYIECVVDVDGDLRRQGHRGKWIAAPRGCKNIGELQSAAFEQCLIKRFICSELR